MVYVILIVGKVFTRKEGVETNLIEVVELFIKMVLSPIRGMHKQSKTHIFMIFYDSLRQRNQM